MLLLLYVYIYIIQLFKNFAIVYNIYMQNIYINNLLKNMCCSDCGADFDHYKVLREEKNILVINLICAKCKKDFGTCILSMCDIKSRDKDAVALELQDGPDLITIDEVIDANNLIKNLKNDWSNKFPKQKF